MAMDFASTRFSFNRPISSYSKIQRIYSVLVRNRGFQARKTLLSSKDLLSIGCGDRINPDFVNIDFNWIPGIDLCWDVRKSLLVCLFPELIDQALQKACNQAFC